MPLPPASSAAAPSSSTTASNTITESKSESKTPSPAFDPAHITVVYVLGGPGAGKGTQCALLVSERSFVHLSAGDLLRAEQNREGSEVGELIRRYIREGTIVPMEITIGLLQKAMQEVRSIKSTLSHLKVLSECLCFLYAALAFHSELDPFSLIRPRRKWTSLARHVS